MSRKRQLPADEIIEGEHIRWREQQEQDARKLEQMHASYFYEMKLSELTPKDLLDLNERGRATTARMISAATAIRERFGDFWLREWLGADDVHEFTAIVLECLLFACERDEAQLESRLRSLANAPFWAVQQAFSQIAGRLTGVFDEMPWTPEYRQGFTGISRVFGVNATTVSRWQKDGKLERKENRFRFGSKDDQARLLQAIRDEENTDGHVGEGDC